MTRTASSMWQDVRGMSFWQTIALLVVGGLSATTGMWVIDTRPPVITLSAVALNPILAPGEALKVRYDVERLRSCAVRLDRTLIDGQRVRAYLDDLDYAGPPGPMGRDSFTVSIPIPRSFSQGRATYSVVARYECNVIHHFWPILTRSEVPFEVRGVPASLSEAPVEVLPVR